MDVHHCGSRINGLYLSDDLRVLVNDSLNLVRCGPLSQGTL